MIQSEGERLLAKSDKTEDDVVQAARRVEELEKVRDEIIGQRSELARLAEGRAALNSKVEELRALVGDTEREIDQRLAEVQKLQGSDTSVAG
jgi:uncharacterized coiled-coil DUF342 family protein